MRIRHEGRQPLALVGANFPDVKTPAAAGEVINTPVKDLLEQFKVVENGVKEDASRAPDEHDHYKQSYTSLVKIISFFDY